MPNRRKPVAITERSVRSGDLVVGLDIELVQAAEFPFQLRDAETGTLFDLAGLAVEGELAGERLEQVATYSAMWFAWASFHVGTELYEP